MRKLYVGEVVRDLKGNETSGTYVYFDCRTKEDVIEMAVSKVGVSFEYLEGYVAGAIEFVKSSDVEIHSGNIGRRSDSRMEMYPRAEFKPLSSEDLERLVGRSVPQIKKTLGLRIVEGE